MVTGRLVEIMLLKRASLVAQRLKRLPPMRETRVRSLDWEDPLEKEMAPHSSILAGDPMDRGAWGAPFYLFFSFLLECSYFTVLCSFLLYNIMTQP